jgi:hypothetical protein
MSSANVANIAIAVVVLALLLSRQLMTRRLSESHRLSIILAVLARVARHEAAGQVTAVNPHVPV